jgi:rod shape-determining protein MreC
VARPGRSNTRIDLIVVIICLVLALAARTLPATMRDPVATSMRRTFLAPLVMLQGRAELSRQSLLLTESKTAIRDSVSLAAMRAASLEGENDRLRKLIGLGSRLRWGFVPAEALHGRGIRDETTVILTAGSQAGVSRLSPVLAPEGMVGVVDAVDPTMSHAMLWTHPDFRVSAMSPEGTAFGIAQAHLRGTGGDYLLELRGVPFRATLKPGTLIVSSGWGGVWPRGIPVGTVLEEIKTSESWARTYLLRPAVNPGDIYSVMILRRDRAKSGLDGVWESVAEAERAAQRIVVTGDSAAKNAAMAEAAARRAVLDSAAARAGGQPLPTATDSARIIAPRPVRRPPPDTPARVIQPPPTDTAPTQPPPTEPPPTDTTPARPGSTQ